MAGEIKADIGALFAEEIIGRKEPEVVWDNNDEHPANEQRWLAFFDKNEQAVTAAEEDYISEYRRRRALAE